MQNSIVRGAGFGATVLALLVCHTLSAHAVMTYFRYENAPRVAIQEDLFDFRQCDFGFEQAPTNVAYYQKECRAALLLAELYDQLFEGRYAIPQKERDFDLAALKECITGTQGAYGHPEEFYCYPGYGSYFRASLSLDGERLKQHILSTTALRAVVSPALVEEAADYAVFLEKRGDWNFWMGNSDPRSADRHVFSTIYYECPNHGPSGNHGIEVMIRYGAERGKMVVSNLANGTNCLRP